MLVIDALLERDQDRDQRGAGAKRLQGLAQDGAEGSRRVGGLHRVPDGRRRGEQVAGLDGRVAGVDPAVDLPETTPDTWWS